MLVSGKSIINSSKFIQCLNQQISTVEVLQKLNLMKIILTL